MHSTQKVGRKKKLAQCFKKWESSVLNFSPKKKKNSNKNNRIFSLAWNIVYWLLKRHSFEFFGDGKYGLFEPKSWWKNDIYWLKCSCFELFGNGKYGLFLRQKLVRRWYYWLLKCYCFEFFGDEKYDILLRQKVDGKMMFTGYWKVLVLRFSVMGNMVWHSRTWEIQFFVQCKYFNCLVIPD